MTILHLLVSNTYNGAENVVCQIVDVFKSDKNIKMIYCSPDGPIKDALIEHGVKFAPLRSLSVKEIRRVIKEYSPSIIHAHDMRANFMVYLANNGIPVISHIHNNNFDSRGLSLKSLMFYIAARKSKHIFWVSQTSFDGYYFKNHLLSKSEILYNVINIDSLKQKTESDKKSYDYDFVYLGRLTFQKNPERLVGIMEKAIRKEPNMKCAILGEGELSDIVRNYIEDNGLSNNIFFLGYSSNPYKILQCSKAMLMTSRWEGLPMCALEAFALGVPVISTPADGLKELIDCTVNGYLSEEDNDLVSQMVRIYNDSEYQQTLSMNAFRKAMRMMNLAKYKAAIKKVYVDYSK